MVGLCRLCASLRKKDLLTSIQDGDNELCQKLRNCCQVIVQTDDALPKSICQECIENLNVSHKFYMKVQEAQETLQALFPTTVEKEDKSDTDSRVDLAQTLAAAASGQKKKRKQTINERNATSRLAGEDEKNKTEKDVKQTKKRKYSGEEVIPTKNNKKEALKIKKTTKYTKDPPADIIKIADSDPKDPPADIIKIADSDSESLETAENNKYLQEVYDLLGMDQEDIIEETNSEILKTKRINEKKVLEDTPNCTNTQEDEYLELQSLGEEHISQEDNIAYHIESVDQELENENVYDELESVTLEEDKEIELDLEYLEEENEEEEEENLLSDMEIESTEERQLEKPISSLPFNLQLNSWKSCIYPCVECEYETINFLDLEAHAKSDHGIKDPTRLQYKCYDCQKIIPRYNYYLNHIRSKHPALKLKCDVCDISCEDYEQLSFHRRANCVDANKSIIILPCTQCFKSFHSKHGLQSHIKLQHTEFTAEEDYQCLQCGKRFQNKHRFKTHELSHLEIKKFSCMMCNSTFSSKHGLDIHLYSHTEEKTFKCNICDKSFKTFIILNQHKVTHSEFKQFKCEYCDKEFHTKIAKTSHERTHTGEMPFHCNHCDKRFRYLSALQAHNRSHSGIKPYACDYCPKRFADSSNRKKHVMCKHPNGEKDENIKNGI